MGSNSLTTQKSSMSEPRRSQRIHTVLARTLHEEKAEQTVARKANRRHAVATESTNEEPVFVDMAAMDDPAYQERLVKIASLIHLVDVAIADYRETDVEIHDVRNDLHKEELKKAREAYVSASQEICILMAELNESDVDEQRKKELLEKQKDLTAKIKDNASKVRKRAADLLSTAAAEVAETGAARAETARKKEQRDKVDILLKQICRKADDLKSVIDDLKSTDSMKELEVREALIKSKDWIKKKDEIDTLRDKIEQDTVGLEYNLDEKLVKVTAMRSTVTDRVAALKEVDREKA